MHTPTIVSPKMAKLAITAMANIFSAVPNTVRAEMEVESTSLDEAREGSGVVMGSGVVIGWGAMENA